jgi:preprotein translocase subunit SecA
MGMPFLRRSPLSGATRVVEGAKQHEDRYEQLNDYELRKESLSLRFRAKSGEPLERLLCEAYALVRVAAQRAIGLRHYDVQMLGGVALFRSAVAEMDTGEGKTLTATLPLYVHSLIGKGAHLATVNDYLAVRDAETMGPVYHLLGLTVGVIQTKDTPDQRRQAYHCDITYGTAKEFGFDFLRDRLLLRRMGHDMAGFLGQGSSHRWDTSGEQPVQRGFHFCLVDEADSILIDEARTPLIIGSLPGDALEQIIASFQWSAANCEKFEEDVDFDYDNETKRVELLGEGRRLMRTIPRDEVLRSVGLVDLYQYMERAIKVDRDFQLDREYVIEDGEIVIVDEFTGRKSEGRKWRDGIHQAIEAKEGVEVTVPTGQAARITIQDLFLRYKNLAGMTGTASSSSREFRKIYKTPVQRIPTNRKILRWRLPDRMFGTSAGKWEAIVAEVKELHTIGRPVLIGTRSIEKSQSLSLLLEQAGIGHAVLNAHEIASEAEIVARAGEFGRVTVATNMAGRGTDITLPRDVSELGGLHVICTELHDSARIDRQLYGRCGRQGDPGTCRQYISIEDDILETAHGKRRAEKIRKKTAVDRQLGAASVRAIRQAQRKVEKKYFRDRSVMLHHEKERKKIQREMGQDPYLDTAD